MAQLNDLIEVFLRAYYTPTTAPLADLLVRYLDENPSAIAGYTERLKKLIADAEAA